MNAIIYIRVSTPEQAKSGYSLKSQKETCINYAISNNYEVLKVFTEKGESAKTANRTEYSEMLSYIKKNKNSIDALIILSNDRLSRDTPDSFDIRLLLKKFNITLRSIMEPFDDTPIGRYMTTNTFSMAQLENEIRGERAKLGMQQAIKAGRWLWNAPLGYKYKYVDNKSYLVPSKDADTVRKIFKDFISGKKQFEICDKLKESKINITRQHLSNLLKNPLYIGKLVTKLCDYEPIDGIHEHIIDDVTFYKAQNILSPKKNQYNIKYKDEFPLKRFLMCPQCGRFLAGSYSKGRYKKYAYYHCVTKGCSFKSVKRELAEELFFDFLDSFAIKEDTINDVFEKIRTSQNERQTENTNTLKGIKKEITILETKKDRIVELLIDGTLPKDIYNKKISEVDTEIINKKIQLNDFEDNKLDVDDIINCGKEFLLDLPNLWVNISIDKKRRLQEFLFPERLYLENNEFRTSKMSSVLRVIEDKNYCQSILAGERGFEP